MKLSPQVLMNAYANGVCPRVASTLCECGAYQTDILSAHAVAALLTECMYPAGWLPEGLLSS